MQGYYLTDDQFVEEWRKIGSPQKFAEKHKMSVRAIYNRRRSIECRLKISLPSVNDARFDPLKKLQQTPGHARRGIEMEKGRVVVFSDAHFWPGDYTTAFKALLMIIKEFKPKVKNTGAQNRNDKKFSGRTASSVSYQKGDNANGF